MRTIILLAVVALGVTAATYTNPVIPNEDTPDPGVAYDPVSGKYYAATTFQVADGAFPIHESTDLVNWKRVGVAFPNGDIPKWGINSFWAPEIHFIGGEWTLFFTARTNKPSADPSTTLLCIGVGKSQTGKPQGPYRDVLGKPLIEDEVNHWGHIDATYYVDLATHKGYLIFKRDGNAYGIPTPIHYAPLNQNGTAIEPPGFDWRSTQLITNTLPWEGPLVEAPWVLNYNSTYYLFYSGNSYTSKYAVGVARSKNLLGPYEKHGDPILHNSDGDTQVCPGHCSVLRAIRPHPKDLIQDGLVKPPRRVSNAKKTIAGGSLQVEDYEDGLGMGGEGGGAVTVMVYHAYRSTDMNTRHTSVDLVQWVNDGNGSVWPAVRNGAPSDTPQQDPLH